MSLPENMPSAVASDMHVVTISEDVEVGMLLVQPSGGVWQVIGAGPQTGTAVVKYRSRFWYRRYRVVQFFRGMFSKAERLETKGQLTIGDSNN